MITTMEAGMAGRPDEQQLEWAASNGRALYSFNRCDFYGLHTTWLHEGRHHSGIILSRQDVSVGEQMRRLLCIIDTLTAEEMRNRIEFLSSWT